MGFDDLPLTRPPAPPPPQPPRRARSSPARWVIVGAGTVVAAALLALWWLSRAQPPAVTPAPTSATEAAARPGRPQRQPGMLPPLPESDGMLRDVVSAVSRHPILTRLLATRGLVRSITLAVVQIGDGKTPAEPLAPARPDGRLQITGTERGSVTPAGFGRWEAAVRALQSVPPVNAAEIYVNAKPLFDEAYRELGFPDGDFDQAIIKAIRMLAAAPNASVGMVLLKRDGYFEHEDAALQSLPPVQKQLLLLGPDLQSQVMSWLRQLASRLELDIRD